MGLRVGFKAEPASRKLTVVFALEGLLTSSSTNPSPVFFKNRSSPVNPVQVASDANGQQQCLSSSSSSGDRSDDSESEGGSIGRPQVVKVCTRLATYGVMVHPHWAALRRALLRWRCGAVLYALGEDPEFPLAVLPVGPSLHPTALLETPQQQHNSAT